MSIAVIAGLVLAWAIGIGVVVASFRRGSAVEERLGEFTRGSGTAVATRREAGTPRPSILVEGLNRAIERRAFFEPIARDLARADIKLTVVEYLIVHIILALGVFVIVWFLRQDWVPGLVAGALSLFAPRLYVGWRQRQRLNRFDGQLADMLNLVVNGLRAGYSVNQALESVSREMPPPISSEFRRVMQEIQLGIPQEDALANLTRRIPSKDLDFVVTAINVQREVGGNLAEILDTISFTIRERVRIRGEIQTLTAQGMITGYVISFLPIGLGVLLYFINPEYIGRFFFQETFALQVCGWSMVITALMLIIIGFLIVRKIVSIEV
ncbi:MAG: type II secretion system F family protein [Anaerolineales bacterium]|nr:type II secretion system F family protein [Anaerolineales bacterium]